MSKEENMSGQKKRNRGFLYRIFEFFEKLSDHFSDLFLGRLKNVREVKMWVAEWALLVASIFLLALVQIFWYSDSYETTEYVSGGTYSEATLGKVNSMNPLYASTSSEKVLSKLLFANLVAPDSSGHLKGELMESLASNDEDVEWTMKLKDNLKWSDGEEIIADDVIYTISLIVDNSAKTVISSDFSNVKVEKIDEKTVKFTLPSAYPDFMDLLEFPIIPQHAFGDVEPALVYESSFSTNPVGSGPFVFNAAQIVNKSNAMQVFYLNRNDNYYGQNTRLDSFNVKTYDSLDAIRDALANVEVNGTAELNNNDINSFNNYDYRKSRINAGMFAFINTKKVELDVRKAIRQGIDMDVVRGELLKDQGMSYPILSVQANYSRPSIPGYDLEAAKKSLSDLDDYSYSSDGMLMKDGKRVSLTVAALKREIQADVAERFAAELGNLGIDVNLVLYDELQSTTDFYSNVIKPRNYDILLYEVDLGISADPFVYYSSTQANEYGWNFSNYSNRMVDDALLSGRLTTDMDLRKAKYESFLKYWVDEVPAIGIYRSNMIYFYTSRLEIFDEDMTLTDKLDRFAGVEYWAVDREKVKTTP